jgi:hypothetical protein
MAASDSGTPRQLTKDGRNSPRVGEAQRPHRRSEIQHGSANIRDTRADCKRLPPSEFCRRTFLESITPIPSLHQSMQKSHQIRCGGQ